MPNRPHVSGRNPAPYSAKGGSFRIVNGPQAFNRALYGVFQPDKRKRFRVFAGDLPEFMLFLPGDGGRLVVGFEDGASFKPLREMERVEASYDGAKMDYTVTDPTLGADGSLRLSAVPLADEAGLIVRLEAPSGLGGRKLQAVYGGASGQSHARTLDPGYTPEEITAFDPTFCAGNDIRLTEGGFALSAPWMKEVRTIGQTTLPGVYDTVDARSLAHRLGGRREAASGEEAAGGATLSGDASVPGGAKLPGGPQPLLRFRSADAAEWNGPHYFLLRCGEAERPPLTRAEAERLYAAAADHYERVAAQAELLTPSELLNAAARTACSALEAIWLPPVFAHGAWSWNSPLSGWRSMYGPLMIGRHDRVREEARHFIRMQLKDGEGAGRTPDPDPAFALARQSGRSVFVSDGMIPYTKGMEETAKYDMQQAFMDQLLTEWEWTGDEAFAKELFPALKRHLAWEERCFDADGDGLYENFANYWASDGVFASGAGCALASAYNYRANLMAAELAERLSEDPEPFRKRALRISEAVQNRLWLAREGHLAESQDGYGARLVHPSASLPTIVHAVESGILDDFQIYQTMLYTKRKLERAEVRTDEGTGELVWNSSWAPYVWSVRDIDYADVLHAALAYYRIGQAEEGYALLLGAAGDSTTRHVSPGAFMCVFEGKSVDFADTASMFARTVAEGLFGIRPELQRGLCRIEPNFPPDWRRASIRLKDIGYEYAYDGQAEVVDVRASRSSRLRLRLKAFAPVEEVTVNGTPAAYAVEAGIGHPYVAVSNIPLREGETVRVQVRYASGRWPAFEREHTAGAGRPWTLKLPADAVCGEIYDPQRIFRTVREAGGGSELRGEIDPSRSGARAFFVRLLRSGLPYWQPVHLDVRPALEAVPEDWDPAGRTFRLRLINHTQETQAVTVSHGGAFRQFSLQAGERSSSLEFRMDGGAAIMPGTNRFRIGLALADGEKRPLDVTFTDWSLKLHPRAQEEIRPIPIRSAFNARSGQLFRQDYVSPRSPYCSLQVPIRLIPSNWCVTQAIGMELINDKALSRMVDDSGLLATEQGIVFLQELDENVPNGAFASRWQQFPDCIELPVGQSGTRLYLLLAGYTNQMQCGVTNAAIEVVYRDGSSERQELIAPQQFRSMEKGPEAERDCDRSCYGDVPLYRIKIGDIRDADGWSESDERQDGPDWHEKNQIYVRSLHAQVTDIAVAPKEISLVRVRAVANDIIIGVLGMTLVP